MADSPVFLGVDVGGTKVAAGLISGSGEIIYKTRTPMVSNGDGNAGLAAVKAAIDQVISANPGRKIAGIGLSSPGPLDPRTGVVINPPNLPCWRNFALRDAVEAAYRLPVLLDNDANAAALAEAVWGSGRGYSSVFYATIGTGIGTGIVFDGRIYHGRTGAAAEGGHMSIDYRGPQTCGCGKRGCIEGLASGPAIARRTRERIAADPHSGGALMQLAHGDVSAITTEMVAAAWRAGDPIATAVLRETADLLSIWLGNTIDLLEPDVIVVGGGVGELISNFFPDISRQLPKWSINQRCCEIPIKLAYYSADAGIAGGAALCLASGSGLAASHRQHASS